MAKIRLSLIALSYECLIDSAKSPDSAESSYKIRIISSRSLPWSTLMSLLASTTEAGSIKTVAPVDEVS